MNPTDLNQRERIPIAPSLDLGEKESFLHPQPIITKRVLLLSIQVVINAIIIGFIAKVLVALINLFTNLFFYQIFSFHESSPANNNLGLLVIIIPVIGGLIIGVMARWGSSAIRGHGIPEAMEQVLVNESRIKPIITILKPLSAAISIGTGGPFGAEGPIISTGGAFGSLAGQIMHISPNERKILLAAGATAGMAAIFGTPIAALLLAIELLLFEFSPRSIIPVSLACATGAAMHFLLFGNQAVFLMPSIPAANSAALSLYVLLGALVGVISAAISKSIYWIEDLFEKLPLHWMWWPAIGALAVGVVGYFAPYTLGVGYANISELLSGNAPLKLILGLCFLKFISWSISLGSGTSGGTLAPLLTIGGATGLLIGLLLQKIFPQCDVNLPTCALIGMASMFAGATRALLTSIVFAFETTLQPHSLLPLLGACTASYSVSFFMMKSTIMTEKIERRGISTPNAYEPNILSGLSVEAIMNTQYHSLDIESAIGDVKEWLRKLKPIQNEIIIVNSDKQLKGILFLTDVYHSHLSDQTSIETLVSPINSFVIAETEIGTALKKMTHNHLQILPVVSKDDLHKVVGIITPSLILAFYSSHQKKQEQLQKTSMLNENYFKLFTKSV